jgi:hypothetical protein
MSVILHDLMSSVFEPIYVILGLLFVKIEKYKLLFISLANELLKIRKIPQQKNRKVKKGIENLFPDHLFTEEFYLPKTKYGDYGEENQIQEFQKMKFCKWICEQRKQADDFVDFKITVSTGKTYIVEVKPAAQTQPPIYPGRQTQRYITESLTFMKNKAKWEAAIEFARDRGWEFKIITEKELGLSPK